MIAGATRGKGGKALARHLTSQKGQTSELVDVRFLSADTTPDALDELVSGSLHGRTDRPVHHLHVDPPEGFDNRESRDHYLNLYEEEFGLQHSPRIIQEHTKKGRTHWHVIYSLVQDDGKMVSLSFEKMRREKISRRTEHELGMPLVKGAHSMAVANAFRKEGLDHIANAMVLAGHVSGDKPIAVTPEQRAQAERTQIASGEVGSLALRAFRTSDNGPSFRSALEAFGLKLAQGDKGPVIVDAKGGAHSLTRTIGTASRLDGSRIPASQVKARIAELSLTPIKEIQNDITDRRKRNAGSKPQPENGTKPETGEFIETGQAEHSPPDLSGSTGSKPEQPETVAIARPVAGRDAGGRTAGRTQRPVTTDPSQPDPHPERDRVSGQAGRKLEGAKKAIAVHNLKSIISDNALKAVAEDLKEFTRQLALRQVERNLSAIQTKAFQQIQQANEPPPSIVVARENLKKAKDAQIATLKQEWDNYEKAKAILKEEKPSGFMMVVTGKLKTWKQRQQTAQEDVNRLSILFESQQRNVDKMEQALKRAEKYRRPQKDTTQAENDLALVNSITRCLDGNPDLVFQKWETLVELGRERLAQETFLKQEPPMHQPNEETINYL